MEDLLSLFNIFTFVSYIFKEIKVRIMLVLYPVSTGDAHHSSRKFAVFAVFVGEFGGVKGNAYLLIDIVNIP